MALPAQRCLFGHPDWPSRACLDLAAAGQMQHTSKTTAPTAACSQRLTGSYKQHEGHLERGVHDQGHSPVWWHLQAAAACQHQQVASAAVQDITHAQQTHGVGRVPKRRHARVRLRAG